MIAFFLDVSLTCLSTTAVSWFPENYIIISEYYLEDKDNVIGYMITYLKLQITLETKKPPKIYTAESD
jgi:hypothetical protein